MSSELAKQSAKLIEKADILLKNEIVQRHSIFQLKYFNLMKEPTIQAKLWQCLTEIKVRRESYTALNLEIEESYDRKALLELGLQSLNLDLEEINNKMLACPDRHEIAVGEASIKIKQQKRKLVAIEGSIEQLKTRLKNLTEEMEFFVSAFQAIVKKEPLKPFDDFDSQKEAWEARLNQELSLKRVFGLPLDTEMLKTILALPDDMAVKNITLRAIEERLQLMEHKTDKRLEDNSGR